MVESGSPPSAIAQTSAKSGGVEGGRDSPLHLPAYLLAARLQTLDGGAPVSGYTVGKELGHGGDALVRRVYDHLGTVRHRSAAVEFRVEQHRLTLRKHISRLQWGRLPFERQPKVEQQNRRIA